MSLTNIYVLSSLVLLSNMRKGNNILRFSNIIASFRVETTLVIFHNCRYYIYFGGIRLVGFNFTFNNVSVILWGQFN